MYINILDPYSSYGFSPKTASMIVDHHTKALASLSSKASRGLPEARQLVACKPRIYIIHDDRRGTRSYSRVHH